MDRREISLEQFDMNKCKKTKTITTEFKVCDDPGCHDCRTLEKAVESAVEFFKSHGYKNL